MGGNSENGTGNILPIHYKESSLVHALNKIVSKHQIALVLTFARVIALNYLELDMQCKTIESKILNMTVTKTDIFSGSMLDALQ